MFLDIALVALLFHAIIVSMKRANAGLALVGILILAAVYVFASQFRLGLTVWILRGFATVFLILLVVVFQRDFRRLFDRIAVWSLRRSPLQKPSEEGTEALAEGLSKPGIAAPGRPRRYPWQGPPVAPSERRRAAQGRLAP